MTTAALAAVLVVAWWDWRIESSIVATNEPTASVDDYVYYSPTLRYGFGQLREGKFPFWNPHQHAGSPFFATGQHELLYPLNLPYLVLPIGLAEKVGALLHLALALLGAALLAATLGLSWPAPIVTGGVFAFAPAVSGLVFLPHHLYAMPWLPVSLALVHRLCAQPERLRWPVLLGLCGAAQFLGGYPMYVVLTAYAAAAYAVVRLGASWRAPDGRSRLARGVLGLVAALLLALSLAAVQLLPALDLVRASVRGGAPLSLAETAVNSVPLGVSVLRTLLPMHDEPLRMFAMPYVGVPALLLAACGAALAPPRSGVRFFFALTALTWLLGLGTQGPLFALWHELPGGSAFRVPLRFFPVTVLGMAVLAGFGVDGLRTLRHRSGAATAVSLLALIGGAALMAVGRFANLPGAASPMVDGVLTYPVFPPTAPFGPLVVRLGQQLTGAGLWLACYVQLPLRVRPLLIALLPVATVAALLPAVLNTAPLPATHPQLHRLTPAVAAYLRQQQGLDRTYIVRPALPFLTPLSRDTPERSGIVEGLFVVGDRENVYLRRFADYAQRLMPEAAEQLRTEFARRLGLPPTIPQGEVVATAQSPNLRLLDLLGTRFIVEGRGARFGPATPPGRFSLVFEANGTRVYENPAAFPRAFLVHHAEVIADADRVLDRLTAPDFDPRRSAIVERPLPVAMASDAEPEPGAARIVVYESDQVAVDVHTPAAALLILTDQSYPDWEATVDGEPVEVLVADYLFRAVAVPVGHHRVVFRFVPRSFWRGVELGVVGAALATALLLAARYQRRT
ncbi:MAG: hypothetical protein SF182_25825 [Deltaproteobacteria bacterium]|nr:hypothetical protein [Deltaproteobacteria bacterium]